MSFTTDRAFELLEHAHERQRLAHAFLISGGCTQSREELAARVIQMLAGNAGEADLFGNAPPRPPQALEDLMSEWVRVVRPQSKSRRITVSLIRELEKLFHMAAGPGTWKVGVIADADRMMPAAENAFLKTLEEPPPRSLLLLLTANQGGMLPTVLSRCVRINLVAGSLLPDEREDRLLLALAKVMHEGAAGFVPALGLAAVFTETLDAFRAEIEAEVMAAFREEEKEYKQIVEGDWLKQREEEAKAEIEARSLSARARLLDMLQSWMADVLRQQLGVAGLELPSQADATRLAAQNEDQNSLLRRISALQNLRQLLETNVHKQLALEVEFLNAFA